MTKDDFSHSMKARGLGLTGAQEDAVEAEFALRLVDEHHEAAILYDGFRTAVEAAYDMRDQAIKHIAKLETKRVAPEKFIRFVYLPQDVCGDGPFASTCAPAGVYEAHFNSQGAVSVRATNRQMLGLKPGEFLDAGGIVE